MHFFDTFSTSELQKVVRDHQFLTLLTWKCASRHNGVHFFNISTSKSGPTMVCFVHFDSEMCFAPQRRALFRHRNFQKWSEAGVFCTFSLGNVLRATTACTFSTSQLPKVVRTWCVLYIFTWKCASRHNGVHFFISHLASWVRTRRFSEPTFRPSGATNHWKNTVNRDFPTFSRICIFFLLIFSLLTLLTSAFQLSILSEVSLLNFLRSNEVGTQFSELRMKCNALHHITTHRTRIHHTTIHQIIIIIMTFASHDNTSHNNNTAGARNIACSRVKWLQPVMKGSSCVRRLRLGPF